MMFINSMLTGTALTLLFFSGTSHAFWRMNCGIIQTGRIDPIVSPGKVSSHVHKIAGAANIGLASTYDHLQQASCTSCEIQADKSVYWTPQMYYQHSDGQFEEVDNKGMTIYYLGRGDKAADIQPFPPGLRMVSGDPLARTYNTSTLTHNNDRPVADRVSFACLDTAPIPESPGMNRTECKNGLRAQIHFQSCWNGKDLYKEDSSHVAYMSRMDNGVCPSSHPVQLMHLFYEVLYSMDSVKQDGGQFVFAHGDTTGYGFHGDFINGWDTDVQEAAIDQCATNNPSGAVKSCAPLAASTISDYSQKCPTSPPVVDEPATGLLNNLPGCIKITPGPERATKADITCPSIPSIPSMNTKNAPPPSSELKRIRSTTLTGPSIVQYSGTYVYGGCYAEGTTGRALSDAGYVDTIGMTVESCLDFCTKKGKVLAGVEYGQECYCGAQFLNGARMFGDGDCDIACKGNETQICGGSWRLSTYQSG